MSVHSSPEDCNCEDQECKNAAKTLLKEAGELTVMDDGRTEAERANKTPIDNMHDEIYALRRKVQQLHENNTQLIANAHELKMSNDLLKACDRKRIDECNALIDLNNKYEHSIKAIKNELFATNRALEETKSEAEAYSSIIESGMRKWLRVRKNNA